jgi:chromate transporter
MRTDAKRSKKTRITAPFVSLPTLFWMFFRIACTSFGGFMAMIAVVQNAVVDRRKLLTHQEMLDGISLASILPGPAAINTVTYVGYRLRGAIGAFVSAVAAISPTFVLIVLLSMAYFRWGQIPGVGKLFMGFVPAVAAIIAAAVWQLGRRSVLGVREAGLAIAAAVIILWIGGFFSTLVVVVLAAAAGWFWFRESGKPPIGKNLRARKRRLGARRARGLNVHVATLLVGAPTIVIPLLSFEPSLLLKIFLTFAGMSLLLFGGAYVFIPIIQEVVVEGHGWVTHQEFVDAVAMSQVMPGPILVSAAFIGLKVAGLGGALAATVGIFAPAAILMVLCTGVLERIKTSTALKGVRPAVVGMIAAAAIIVAKTAAPTWISALIFLTALIALLRFRVEAVWIVPIAGAVGLALY